MNAMNNFTISGFVVKDAEVKNFEKSSIARFGLSFKTSEKNGNTEVVKSAIVNIETWIKNDDAATKELLKKGSLIKIEGFFKADPYTKDGKSVNQYRLVATKIAQGETVTISEEVLCKVIQAKDCRTEAFCSRWSKVRRGVEEISSVTGRISAACK